MHHVLHIFPNVPAAVILFKFDTGTNIQESGHIFMD